MEKGERSWAVRTYDDVTREDAKTPFRLIPRRLAGASDHANYLPEIGPQAHPIKQANQGVECTMEPAGVRRGNNEIVCIEEGSLMPNLLSTLVGDCGKAGRKNGAMECPDIGTHNGTYNDFILEKGERSWAVRTYDDVTREDAKTPLGKNRLIIS